MRACTLSDGAREALAGYLYQIIGGAGLSAHGSGGHDDVRGLDCELVVLAEESRILHEVHGEDVVLEQAAQGGIVGTAVQFKHSRAASTEVIEPADLREILHAFDRCRQAAAPHISITRFILVTNRPLSTTTSLLYNKRDPTAKFSKLTEPLRKWLITPNRSVRDVKERYGTVKAAAEAWYGIYQGLRIYSQVPPAVWLERLRRYALAHGLPEEEHDAAINRVVGAAVQATAIGDLEFSRAWLNRHLFGFPDARRLTLTATGDTARGAAHDEVLQFLRRSFAPDEGALVRRRLLDEIARQASQHAVVFLLGSGGCGKSVLAIQYLREQGSRCFVACESARALEQGWLGRTFNSLRSTSNVSSLPTYSEAEVVRRLRLANPDTERPLLAVALDGLDEVAPLNRSEVRRLISSGNSQRDQPAEALFIVTSRSEEQELQAGARSLFAEWLPTDLLPELIPVGLVPVREFDDEELRDAADRIGGDVAVRIRRAVAILKGETASDAEVGEEVAADTGASVADPTLIASLRHPVVWGEFSRLNAGYHLRILESDPTGFRELADRLLRRFCLKVNRRRDQLRQDRTRRALVAIGARTPAGNRIARRDSHWIAPARVALPDADALILFDEAISYGLVREDARGQWSWRHPFVGDYLRTQGG